MPDESEKTKPTEDDIAKLIADTNPNFPLTRVNALIARTPHEGTVFGRVRDTQGADIIFRYKDGTPFFREVKCIIGGRNAFNRDLQKAVKQLGVPAYIDPIPQEYAKANFQNVYRYLAGFVERYLPYCRNCFINPDEVGVNFKLAEKLKPILLELFHG